MQGDYWNEIETIFSLPFKLIEHFWKISPGSITDFDSGWF